MLVGECVGEYSFAAVRRRVVGRFGMAISQFFVKSSDFHFLLSSKKSATDFSVRVVYGREQRYKIIPLIPPTSISMECVK